MPKLFKQLWFLTLLATMLGIAVGITQPANAIAMQPLGDGFVRLIKMIIAPVVFCTIVHGIAGMQDMKRLGRVAGKALIYFLLLTTVALLIGLIAINQWRVGVGMNIDASTLDANAIKSYTSKVSQVSNPVDFLLNIIPMTLLSAFVESQMLQVVLVSVLFGVALSLLSERGKPVFDLIESLSHVLFKIVGYVMWLAPLGAFGAIAYTVGKFGGESLRGLLYLIVELYLVCAVFVFVVLGGIAYACKVNLFKLLRYLKEEIIVVAATTSTESVLPQLMDKLKRLGCQESVVSLVVPTGYSFNLDGTCLYLSVVTVFLAQATNTPLDIQQQLTLLLVLLIVSKGAAGVAGAALVVLAATLTSIGTIPVASLAIIVGIHRILAEALTFVNLIGNSVATIVVAKWEGALDESVMYAQLSVDATQQGAYQRSLTK